jgi:PAS domain S-box-containing protein
VHPPSRRTRLQARILPFIGLGAVLFILLANGAAAIAALNREHDDSLAIVQSYAVVDALGRTLTTLVNAETGQRGYLLTGQSSYLTPYKRARRDIRARLSAARALTRHDPRMQANLSRLTTMIDVKFGELARTIRLSRAGHHAAATALVRTDRGQKEMIAIRTTIGAMENAERTVLAERRRTADNRLGSVRTAVFIAAGADMLLLLIAALLLTRLFRGSAARERATSERAAILDLLADGVIVADMRRYITFMNDAAEAFLSISWQSGMTVGDLERSPALSEDPATRRSLVEALEARHPLRMEQRVTGTGAAVRILDVQVAPLDDPRGGAYGTVVTLRDITERWQSEEQKTAFLAAAAHDLKNPLASIKGLAQLARRRAQRLIYPDDDYRARFLRDLESLDRVSGRMADLVTELLDVSRNNPDGQTGLDLQCTDLTELVRSTGAEAQLSLHNHALVLDLPSEPLEAEVDRPRLQRIVGNLISNAVKYSPQGGNVTLRAACEAVNGTEWAVIRVIDTGLGIPADEQKRIFERYYRASNVPAHVEGTGIGLAAARQIIRLHGGDIEITSTEGAGTEVVLRLPLQRCEAEARTGD